MVGGVGVGQVHVAQPLLQVARRVRAVAFAQLASAAKELRLFQLDRLGCLGALSHCRQAALHGGRCHTHGGTPLAAAARHPLFLFCTWLCSR
eukprot:3800652-Prymnesium_polylepis.1